MALLLAEVPHTRQLQEDLVVRVAAAHTIPCGPEKKEPPQKKHAVFDMQITYHVNEAKILKIRQEQSTTNLFHFYEKKKIGIKNALCNEI